MQNNTSSSFGASPCLFGDFTIFTNFFFSLLLSICMKDLAVESWTLEKKENDLIIYIYIYGVVVSGNTLFLIYGVCLKSIPLLTATTLPSWVYYTPPHHFLCFSLFLSFETTYC